MYFFKLTQYIKRSADYITTFSIINSCLDSSTTNNFHTTKHYLIHHCLDYLDGNDFLESWNYLSRIYY